MHGNVGVSPYENERNTLPLRNFCIMDAGTEAKRLSGGALTVHNIMVLHSQYNPLGQPSGGLKGGPVDPSDIPL